MSVNKKNKRKKQKPTNAFGDNVFKYDPSGQPPAFQAKGRGYANRLPDVKATKFNANASVTNRAANKVSDDLTKLYLWVDSFSSGWRVAGQTSQAHSSRTFYPLHLSQNDLVIQGQMANQYEYDKLVRFVTHHQSTILNATNYQGTDFLSVDFAMFKPGNGRSMDHFRPLKYKVAIMNISAGHERFVFAPAFTLTCKVLFDYNGQQTDIVQALDRKINYHEIFGAFKNVTPHIGETAAETKAAATAKKAKAKAAADLKDRQRYGRH